MCIADDIISAELKKMESEKKKMKTYLGTVRRKTWWALLLICWKYSDTNTTLLEKLWYNFIGEKRDIIQGNTRKRKDIWKHTYIISNKNTLH